MDEQTLCDVCPTPKEQKTYFCSTCNCTFCDEHWEAQVMHKPGRGTLGGRPHVKEDKAVIERMHSVLEPSQDPAIIRDLHQKDQDARWFGIVRSEIPGQSASHFHDFRRYAQLMIDSRPLTGALRYPKLISFIGDTNAGKSTIVKALISHGVANLRAAQAAELEMPVPGSVEHESTATSEGVHLYADPALLESERPILYADCEGLNAGEKPPFAVEVNPRGDGCSPRHRLQRRLQPLIREIKWFKNGDPVRGTREFAVGHLYPRFLYTFSDAIVFVQKNPRQIHTTYKYLIDWARLNVEEAINQPILPHAIIVLNAVDIGTSSTRWTVEDATQAFFRDVEEAVFRDFELRKLAELRGIDPMHTSSSRQLLRCFYSEVNVIRIPQKMPDRYALINEQIGKLHQLIVTAGNSAHYAKLVCRRLNDVDALQEYLQAGFDHFAADIDRPFDFKKVFLRSKTIAQDFGDHIVNLASTAQEYTRVNERVLFKGLVSLVASCILLDYARNDMPGSVMDYFPSSYAPLCAAALARFCDEYVPCDFVDKRKERCNNVKSTHVKGHQNSKGKITSGEYQSSFNAESYEDQWIRSLESKLKQLEEQFNVRRTKDRLVLKSDVETAVKMHSNELNQFFSQLNGGSMCVSNSTCFGCLMALPEIPLACGHALCKLCISEHSENSSDVTIHLRACPLHSSESFDWEVPQKPDFAGIRMLTLDGGGMRGIVELEILKAIEERINVGSTRGLIIPIQRFFDLVVGTSTGGIIALGLTVKNWSVDDCIIRFMRLCDTAFTPRELSESALRMIATLNHGSKWKTKPFRNALKNEFGTQPLFGGSASNGTKYFTKVAVVTTSQSGCRSLLVANYNREQLRNFNHSLELPNDPKHNLAIWEAAAATSAAPSYFKAFECHGKTYLDGALNHNNPIRIAWRERQMIWPDVMSKQPDILISLGTGQHKAENDAKLKRDGRTRPRVHSDEGNSVKSKTDKSDSKRYRAWHNVKNYFSVLVSKIDDILDTERVWDDFFNDTVGERWSTEDSSRYVRINPDLGSKPPKLDEKDKLQDLQNTVHRLPQTDLMLNRTIEDVANRLFASSFYFKKLSQETNSQGFIVSGSLHSKFERNPVYVEQVARFLKHQVFKSFVPKFVFSQHLNNSSEKKRYDISKDFIDNMLAQKEFKFDRKFEIQLSHQDEPTYICLQLRSEKSGAQILSKDYPISGFPRRFLVEENRSAKLLQRRKAEFERRRRQDSGMSSGSHRPPEDVSQTGFRRLISASPWTLGSLSPKEEPDGVSLSDTEYESADQMDGYEKQLEESGTSR